MKNTLILSVYMLLFFLVIAYFLIDPGQGNIIAENNQTEIQKKPLENSISAPQLMLNIINSLPATVSKYLIK